MSTHRPIDIYSRNVCAFLYYITDFIPFVKYLGDKFSLCISRLRMV